MTVSSIVRFPSTKIAFADGKKNDGF